MLCQNNAPESSLSKSFQRNQVPNVEVLILECHPVFQVVPHAFVQYLNKVPFSQHSTSHFGHSFHSGRPFLRIQNRSFSKVVVHCYLSHFLSVFHNVHAPFLDDKEIIRSVILLNNFLVFVELLYLDGTRDLLHLVLSQVFEQLHSFKNVYQLIILQYFFYFFV